ncbi:MAG: hypothetical protein ABS81_07300 [Pseudonocardia sp. SCN 72-86]|nr:MAG: hypothetical protein ABS81_07300 [Pseudonocardia sp. SCN 72-86]
MGGGNYPPPPGPPSPPRKSNTGKIVAIVVVVLVVLIGAGGFFAYRAVTSVAAGVTGGMGGDCPAVSTDDVNSVLGGTFDVIAMGGVGSIAAPLLDSRVLPDAETCWAVDSGTGQQNDLGKLARIARYSGSDAATRFQAELTKAQGTSEDRGNGITVSSSAYFAKSVEAGDEAFCTTGDGTSAAGALVRRGDLLVYVSTTAGGDGGIPQVQFDPDADPGAAVGFATDDANCDLAVKLAEKVT